MPEHTPRDGDAERRLSAIRSYRLDPNGNRPSEETVFLLGQIDARDAALREKDDEIARLRSHVNSQSDSIEARDRLIFGPREEEEE